jgi:hypothetical protein
LQQNRDFLVELGAIYGGVAAIKDLTKGVVYAITRTIRLLQRKASDFEARNATGFDLLVTIDELRDLSPDKLARGLSLTPTETSTLLGMMGYELDTKILVFRRSRSRSLRFQRLVFEGAVKADRLMDEDEPKIAAQVMRAGLFTVMRLMADLGDPDEALGALPDDFWLGKAPPQ